MTGTDHHQGEDRDEIEDLPFHRHERSGEEDDSHEDEEEESEHDPELRAGDGIERGACQPIRS